MRTKPSFEQAKGNINSHARLFEIAFGVSAQPARAFFYIFPLLYIYIYNIAIIIIIIKQGAERESGQQHVHSEQYHCFLVHRQYGTDTLLYSASASNTQRFCSLAGAVCADFLTQNDVLSKR